MIPFPSTFKRAVETEPTEIPMLIGGEWRTASEAYEVRDPYRGTVVAHAPRPSMKDLDDALNAAVKAKAKAAATPAYECSQSKSAWCCSISRWAPAARASMTRFRYSVGVQFGDTW